MFSPRSQNILKGTIGMKKAVGKSGRAVAEIGGNGKEDLVTNGEHIPG